LHLGEGERCDDRGHDTDGDGTAGRVPAGNDRRDGGRDPGGVGSADRWHPATQVLLVERESATTAKANTTRPAPTTRTQPACAESSQSAMDSPATTALRPPSPEVMALAVRTIRSWAIGSLTVMGSMWRS
jgi:hypothetical protein